MYLSGIMDASDRATREAWAAYSLTTIAPLINSADWSATINNPNAPALARFVLQRMQAGATALGAATEYFTSVHPELYPGPLGVPSASGGGLVTSPVVAGRTVVDVGLPTDPWVIAGQKAAADIAAGGGRVVFDPTSPTGTRTIAPVITQASPTGGPGPAQTPNDIQPGPVQPGAPVPSMGGSLTWILLGLVGLALLRK